MGLETIVMLALSYGASFLAASLADKPKQKNFLRDDKPTTLADRGSYVPLVLGRRRIGYLFGWAGNRDVKQEVTGETGGKGGGGSKKTYANVYHEDGWHILCVGPVWALHGIRQEGIVIFGDTITQNTTPSGSVIDLGKEGAFQIFWGECDQPINTMLGTGIGINSRWPHVCSIYWISKRLGTSARWGTIDYELEVLPTIDTAVVAESYHVYTNEVVKFTGEPVNPANEAWSTAILAGLASTVYSEVMNKDGSCDLILTRRRNIGPRNNVMRVRHSDGVVLWVTSVASGDTPKGSSFDEQEDYFFHNHTGGTSLARLNVVDGTLDWEVENGNPFGYTGSQGVAVLSDDAVFLPKAVVAIGTNSGLGTNRLLLFDHATGYPINSTNDEPDPAMTPALQKEFDFQSDFTSTQTPYRILVWHEGRQLIVPHTGGTLAGGAPIQTPTGLANVTAFDIDTGAVVWRSEFLAGSHSVEDLALIDPAGDNPKIVAHYGGAPTSHAILSLVSGQEGLVLSRINSIANSATAQPRWDSKGHVWSGEVSTNVDMTVVEAEQPDERVYVRDISVTPPPPGSPLGFNVVPRGPDIVAATSVLNEGVRPDIVIKQLMTGTYPHGMGIHPSLIDCQSLNALNLVAQNELLGVNILLADGIVGSQAIADMMQDIGMMLYENGNALKFQMIREVTSAPLLTDDFVLPPQPEIDYTFGPKKTDRMVFTFKDRAKNYRDVDLQVDDDSSSSQHGRPNTRKISISSVTDHGTASSIVNRRQQEELASLVGFRLNLTRDGADLRPGEIFIVENVATMICMATEIDPQDRKAKVDAVASYYADVVPDFVPGEGINTAETLPVAPDAPFFPLETPYSFSNGQDANLAISVVRNRAHQEIAGADVWVSSDDITYDLSTTQNAHAPGGDLDDDFDTTELAPCGIVEDGPRFTTDDPAGITTVENLDADETGWRSGIQACIIVDTATSEFEIFYLRSIEALGSNQYRLKGLINCRGESQPRAHVIGDRVFIFRPDSIRQQLHAYLSLDVTTYVKTQPRTSAEIQSLSDVTSQGVLIKGNAFRPLPLSNFYGNWQEWGPLNEFATGTDIDFSWTYRIKPGQGLGAGQLPAGVPIGTDTPSPEGTFTIVFTDVADVVKRTVTGLTSPAYIYTNANLVSDFTSEPASFKAKVQQVNGAYSTDVLEITIVRV